MTVVWSRRAIDNLIALATILLKIVLAALAVVLLAKFSTPGNS